MALVINQGKQDTSQDNKFNPIVCDDTLAVISSIELAKGVANTLEITLRLLEGPYKNRFVFDRIMYAATKEYDGTWKYRSLRNCAGVPYQENEPANVDIEKLLLNKAVIVKLSIRKGKNKDGEEQDYQNIVYKKKNDKTEVDGVADIEAIEDSTKPKATKPATKKAKPAPKVEEVVEEFEEVAVSPGPNDVSHIETVQEDTSVPVEEDVTDGQVSEEEWDDQDWAE